MTWYDSKQFNERIKNNLLLNSGLFKLMIVFILQKTISSLSASLRLTKLLSSFLVLYCLRMYVQYICLKKLYSLGYLSSWDFPWYPFHWFSFLRAYWISSWNSFHLFPFSYFVRLYDRLFCRNSFHWFPFSYFVRLYDRA